MAHIELPKGREGLSRDTRVFSFKLVGLKGCFRMLTIFIASVYASSEEIPHTVILPIQPDTIHPHALYILLIDVGNNEGRKILEIYD